MTQSLPHWNGKRLRVAHVSPQLEMGGMEKLLTEFARHADRATFSLSFVSLASCGRLAKDIEVHGWPVDVLHRPSGLQPALAWELGSYLRSRRIDVVHTHNTRALIYGSVAARLAGVRHLIHTSHGQLFEVTRRGTFLFGIATMLADRIVCVSEDVARLSPKFGIPPKKVVTIRNGIDSTRFPYHGPQNGGPAVMVGRMVPLKDVETLLRATAQVVRVCPDFRLEIAGDGPSLPNLRQLAQSLSLDREVHFLGEVRDISGLLARASFFVMSSLSEGISLTILEAMASGLPVVATQVGGTPEVVRDGETGYLVPSQNPEQLAEAMLRLHRDPLRAKQMGVAARQRLETHFEIRRMVAEYEALYLRLSKHRRAASESPSVPDRVRTLQAI